MIPDRDFSAMDRDAILMAETSDWIAVLPLGAHEQHGPHLPFETDSVIAEGIAMRLSEYLEEDIPFTVLPVERVGYSVEHLDYNGSRSLSYDEAIERWISIGKDLSDLGIRKLLLLNAHGGNSSLMSVVATELRVRFNMLCVATSWTRFILPGEVVSNEEKALGIHGGEIETSVMLAFAPELVDMSSANDFSNFQETMTESYKHLRAYGPHAFGWKMQDLNVIGVTGNASAATTEKGEALVAQAVNGLSDLLRDMHSFDPVYFLENQI